MCEHLPKLAQRTDQYALIRSISTDSSGHGEACHALLAGRLDIPPGFNINVVPSPLEWPSIPSQVMHATRPRNNVPAAVVLPQPSVNEANSVRPGQYAGRLGSKWESWHIDIAAPCALGNGACPHCFRFDTEDYQHGSATIFDTPMLTLPEGGSLRLNDRVGLLAEIERQQRNLEMTADADRIDRQRQQAL